MRHLACDFAKHFMQVAFAGTDVWLSDGSTTVMPVPIHRAQRVRNSRRRQQERTAASVHAAWKLHFDDIRHSLAGGFYQGWDLHPAQLVTRYAALYSFFLEGIDAAGAASQQLRRQGGAGDAGRRRVRRCRHRTGASQLLSSRNQLRRHHRRGGASHDGPHGR